MSGGAVGLLGESSPQAVVLLQLDAEAGLVDAVPGLLLGCVVLRLLLVLFSPSLTVSGLSIEHADVLEVSCDATAALIVFSWAVTVVNVFLLYGVEAAVRCYLRLFQALLVG